MDKTQKEVVVGGLSKKISIQALTQKKQELLNYLEKLRDYKAKTIKLVDNLELRYYNNEISLAEFRYKLNQSLKGKTFREWISYYDGLISQYNNELLSLDKEIKEFHSKSLGAKTLLIILIFLMIGISSIILFKPVITGFVVYQPGQIINETLTLTIPEDITINESIVRASLNLQQSELPLSNFNITLNLVTINLEQFNILAENGTLITQIIFNDSVIAETSLLIETQVIRQIENVTGLSNIKFDRNLDCPRCGQHKVPSNAVVNMTIKATFEGTTNNNELIDYYPISWGILDTNGGVISNYDTTWNKISWNLNNNTDYVERVYIIQAPTQTIPPTKYNFKSELAGIQSDLWDIIVADPACTFTVTLELPSANLNIIRYENFTAQGKVVCGGGGSRSSANVDLRIRYNATGTAADTLVPIDLSAQLKANESQFNCGTLTNDVGSDTCIHNWNVTGIQLGSVFIDASQGASGTNSADGLITINPPPKANRAPSQPSNLQPLNDTKVKTLTPSLNWTNSSDEDNDILTYILDISDTADFNNINYSAKEFYVNFTGNPGIEGGFNLNISNPNIFPLGITFNGSDFWWVDNNVDYVYHFNSSGANITGSPGLVGGFTLTKANPSIYPRNIDTNGSDFWITDQGSSYIYHFDAFGNNITGSPGLVGGFSIKKASPGVTNPRGITTNGSDFWVIGGEAAYVYHFDAFGNNITGSPGLVGGFTLTKALANPVSTEGLVTNGSDFWWVDSLSTDFVYHFDAFGNNITGVDGGFSVTKAFSASVLPEGIATDRNLLNPGKPNDFWIVDSKANYVFHFKGAVTEQGIQGNTTQHNVTIGLNDNTNYYWRVKAFDGSTSSAYSYGNFTTQVSVAANSPPNNVSSLIINSTTLLQLNLTTEDLQVRFNVSDPNAADTLNYSIQWFTNNRTNFTLTGISVSNPGTAVETLQHTNTTKGENWSAQVIVCDNNNACSVFVNTSQLLIRNSNATITQPAFNQTTYNTNHIINVSAVFSDDDQDTNSVTFQWFKNNATIRRTTNSNLANGTNSSDILTTNNFVAGDDIRVMAFAYDGERNSTLLNSTIIIIQSANTAPNNPSSLVINSTNTAHTNRTQEDLRMSFQCDDPDASDVLTFSLTAFKDKVNQFQLRGSCSDPEYKSVVLNAINTTKNDNWSFSVNVSDDDNAYSATISTVINISILNTAPVIGNVTLDEAGSIDLVESGNKTFRFSFVVTDADNQSDIVNASAVANITRGFGSTAETTRYNDTFVNVNDGGCRGVNNVGINGKNFSCTINVVFYDAAGLWNISVRINDSVKRTDIVDYAFAQNTTKTFTINELTALTISPGTISFPTVGLADVNVSARNNLTITNTGNDDISGREATGETINITAITLIGETDSSTVIPTNNFSIGTDITNTPAPSYCDFSRVQNTTRLVNYTAALSAYNNFSGMINGSFVLAQAIGNTETLAICLLDVPNDLSASQNYSTLKSASWSISIFFFKRKKDKPSKDKEINSIVNSFLEQHKLSHATLKILIEKLKEFKLSSDEIINLLTKKVIPIELPVSIFDNKELSALESIAKYLKENLGYNYARIASLLNRDQRTIWTTYKNALEKRKEKLIVKETKYIIPISIFSDREFGVLELISEYLKDNYMLSYHEIALLLNRDYRTIYTVYKRAKDKLRI